MLYVNCVTILYEQALVFRLLQCETAGQIRLWCADNVLPCVTSRCLMCWYLTPICIGLSATQCTDLTPSCVTSHSQFAVNALHCVEAALDHCLSHAVTLSRAGDTRQMTPAGETVWHSQGHSTTFRHCLTIVCCSAAWTCWLVMTGFPSGW